MDSIHKREGCKFAALSFMYYRHVKFFFLVTEPITLK